MVTPWRIHWGIKPSSTQTLATDSINSFNQAEHAIWALEIGSLLPEISSMLNSTSRMGGIPGSSSGIGRSLYTWLIRAEAVFLMGVGFTYTPQCDGPVELAAYGLSQRKERGPDALWLLVSMDPDEEPPSSSCNLSEMTRLVSAH
ncbi:hypothetical protein Tco_0255852 [Tanacetum coccineum]